MARIASIDTSPELFVRRAAHAAGFRFRLHRRDLPGKPDLVFPRLKIAVFVNGCFWHWHGCKRSRMPQANREYWEAKIARNVARDKRSYREIKNLGWKYSVVWECNLVDGTRRLIRALKKSDNDRQHPSSVQ